MLSLLQFHSDLKSTIFPPSITTKFIDNKKGNYRNLCKTLFQYFLVGLQ